MRRLWQGVVRTIFWSYDRGSWPYDLMVIAIVAFVLLTPAKWFHDQPQSSTLPASSVQMISQDASRRFTTYRIDASLMAPDKRQTKPTPELERETHDILGRTVGSLKDSTFQVTRIDPVRASDGSVLYYDVTVHP